MIITNKLKTVQCIALCRFNCVLYQFVRLRITCRCMIRQTLQGHFLFGHQLAGILIHLRIVNAQTAKYRKSLENRNIFMGKRLMVGLNIRGHRFIVKFQLN